MKKKSLLFLSLCAWTLQSHLVQADTIAETANQASQETETLSLSNSNTSASTSASQQATTAVSSESTKQSESVNAEVETTSDTQTASSKGVESTDKTSELASQAESVSSNPAVSKTTNSVSTHSTTSERSAVTLAAAGSNNAVVASTASTSVATRSADTSSTQSPASTQTSNVVAVENVNAVNGSFDVRVSKVSSPKEIKTVYMPTWSEVHGQDDIIWYAAKRQLDGSYLINVNNDQHKNSVGKYHSHVYYLATDGSLSPIGATSTVLPEVKASGTVAAVNVNSNTGSFEVKVSNIVAPRGLSKVLVPTWTDSKGQDDIVWHEAQRQTDGSYLAKIAKTQHKNESGHYTSHVYYLGTDGSLTGIGATSAELKEIKASGTVAAVNVNSNTGSFEVKVSNIVAPRGLSKVLVPTWTDAKGQDDIVWHEAQRQTDGSYIAKIAKTQHKNESGHYTSHVYYLGTDGSLTGIGATSAELKEIKASGTVAAVNVNSNTGSFEVKVSNIVAPRGLSKVLIPTWTDSKGQDDIVWHEAQRQTDGSYLAKIAKTQHKNESGHYTSHVYYLGTDGSLTGIGATSAELKEIKASGTVAAVNVNSNTGSFEVKVSNIVAPRGLSKVLVPTWTDSKGQDDIVWHEAQRQTDGSYIAKIAKTQHKNESGKYTSHVYYLGTDGSLTGIGATSAELKEIKASGTVTTVNINANNGSYQVKISDIVAPLGLDKVLVPTWTDAKGQDDIVWHEAQRQKDGTYLTTITKAQHKFESGKYISHVYYRAADGSLSAVGATSAVLPEVKVNGTFSVSNINATDGKFDVRVTDIVAPRGLDKVYLPTWTDAKGQDDIKWHEAQRQSDGSYALTIESSKHRYSSGLYHVHAYYRGLDGSMMAVGATSVELPEGAYTAKATQRSYTVYIDPGHGGRDSGASYSGIHEKNLAMSVSNKLRDNLLQRGINVLMTRTGDYDVDFRTERSRMANNSEADLFVSIHFNATGAGVQSSVKGIETYWYQYDPEYQPKINQEKHNDPTRLAESEILANKVQSSLIKETGAVDRGVRRETFAVLRETAIPAILVELGFMDNPTELNVIKTDSYHTKLANALTQGIVDWYGAVEGK
ncbi:TPA: GBS Bsp-like repeat-containing protein [Streptococcus suis]